MYKPFICIHYTDEGLRIADTRDLQASVAAYAPYRAQWSYSEQIAISRIERELAHRKSIALMYLALAK